MDRRAILFLSLIVVASGCIHSDLPGSELPSTGTPSTGGAGLQVETFDVSDSSIGSGQTGIISLELVNYHNREITPQDISLYNTGVLEVERQGCSSETIGAARPDYKPRLECTWTVSAPEDASGSFESKTVPVKLNLEYDSKLSNSDQPVKVHFKPVEDISSTEPLKKSFSNSEVSLRMETERPIPFEGRTVTVTANNAGNGRVDSNYTFEFFPENVFRDCGKLEKKPIVDQEVEFTCRIQPQAEAERTRNLIISTSYKYVKAPTLDIRVVDTQ